MYRKTYRTYHNLFDRKFFKKIYIGCPSLFPFTNFQGCFYFILTRIPSPSPLFSSHYVYNTSPVEHVHIDTFRCERLYILSYRVTHAHILIVRRNSFHTVMRDCVDRFLYAFWFLCLYPYACNIGCFKIDFSGPSLYRVF